MANYEIVWKILSLRCEEASRLSSESLDHCLPISDRLACKLHLMICVSCRRYRRDILDLRRIAIHIGRPVDNPVVNLPSGAKDRIKGALERD